MHHTSTPARTIALLFGALLAIATPAVSGQASAAENWPTRPIKIIVPFAAGGAVDLVARFLQTDMGKALATTMFVEDRGGGAGVPASEELINSPPDGYTVALVSSNYASNAVMQPHLSYDPIKDITPISMTVINTVLILVPADSSIHTLADLVAQAKAKPGALSYGTPGVGTAMNFAGELLRSRAHINITQVPYRGAAPALNDLLGHQIPIAIMGIGPSLPYIKSGKLRAIAITTDKRSKFLPDVPTVAEAGYPGFSSGEWFAMIAPKGLAPDITVKLHDAVVTAIESPDVKAKIESIGLETTSSTPQQLHDFMVSETERFRRTASEAKMLDHK